MSKDIRITLLIIISALISRLPICAQDRLYPPMPDTLDMKWLLKQPKYRNIHHDAFARDNNATEIGNNAVTGRKSVMSYETLSVGDINVGIHDGYTTNFQKSHKSSRCIKYIRLDKKDYHIAAVMPKGCDGDVKVALRVIDIDNFYFIILNKQNVTAYRYRKGRKKMIFCKPTGGERLELHVINKTCEVCVDGKTIKNIKIIKAGDKDNKCGLYYDNTSISRIDDFIVDYPDIFEESGIDAAIESNEVEKPEFGAYCAEKGACTSSAKVTKNSRRSYRFELVKPTQKQVDINSNTALHSTVMLNGISSKGGNGHSSKAGGNKPLDSYVFSVDVFFPASGDERWEIDDKFQELFIQEHHVGYSIPFSPSLALIFEKGRLVLNLLSMETVAKGKTIAENSIKNRREFIARMNNVEEELELYGKGFGNYRHLPYLERGKWHNFTMYVKLGYNENQQPRTVLYIDSKKVADWHTPNAYNCQEFGEYLEFGIYKWSWSTQENRDNTPIKKRVLYFDNIHYYI